VREYLVWRVLDRQVDWFVLRSQQYERLSQGTDGLLRSEAFPGLWLDPGALVGATWRGPRSLNAWCGSRPAFCSSCHSSPVFRIGGSTGKRIKQICYLMLERRYRVFQCRTRICVKQMGIANVSARPEKAVLPDG
jgi:hypothetical protein